MRDESKADWLSFGARVKWAREQKPDVKQEHVARAAGVKQSVISDIERGEAKSSGVTASIAYELGVNALWLETGRGRPDLPECKDPPLATVADAHVAYDSADLATLADTLPPLFREAARLMVGELAKLAGVQPAGRAGRQPALDKVARFPKGLKIGEINEPNAVPKRTTHRRTKRTPGKST